MGIFKDLLFGKNEEPAKPSILLEQNSPSCPISAIVEQDDRAAYFYLWGGEDSPFGLKSCWMRNLKQAPLYKQKKKIKQGLAPMLPLKYCAFPDGQEALKAEELEIVWLEEGDGAALLENGEILAIIPAWGGAGGFSGYARDCKEQSELCWPLLDSSVMFERVEAAQAYWNSWTNKEQNPFYQLQPQILQVYEAAFGESETYYAIDGKKWPPKGLYRKSEAQQHHFATVGVSLRPQPMVEMLTETPEDLNRIELALKLTGDFSASVCEEIVSWISGSTNIPWDRISWLGEGHTLAFDAFNHPIFKKVVLSSELEVLPKLTLPSIKGTKPNLLWMIPISELEWEYATDKGSEELIEKLAQLGEDIFSLDRAEIIQSPS